MTYHEELEAEIAALHRKIWELEYQQSAALIAYGLTSFPAPPPRLFNAPATVSEATYEASE
jgi:hypothetical protein